MTAPLADTYLELMRTVRERLDVIELISRSDTSSFALGETAAFHGRKVAEGIAFGCLVATENGLDLIPRDAKGQWNADKIVESLSAKGINTFPSPSSIRQANDEERRLQGVTVIVEGIPENRISKDEFVAIYSRLHRWLHELNPYVYTNRRTFMEQNSEQLWADLRTLDRLIGRHFISISGEGFFCTLRDKYDGKTKVLSLSKAIHISNSGVVGA